MKLDVVVGGTKSCSFDYRNVQGLSLVIEMPFRAYFLGSSFFSSGFGVGSLNYAGH
jgi:hypothetical protein